MPSTSSETSTITVTTESVVVNSQPTGYSPSYGTGERISGMVSFTGNAAASTVILRVRQGAGLGGTAVYTSPAITVAAAAVMSIPFDVQDTVGGVNVYTVSATFSGAPGGGGAVYGIVTVEQTGYND